MKMEPREREERLFNVIGKLFRYIIDMRKLKIN